MVTCLLGMLQAEQLYGDAGLTVDQLTSPGFTGASTSICCFLFILLLLKALSACVSTDGSVAAAALVLGI